MDAGTAKGRLFFIEDLIAPEGTMSIEDCTQFLRCHQQQPVIVSGLHGGFLRCVWIAGRKSFHVLAQRIQSA
ncbi:MAG: hypothetical protein CML69_06755 [Rhodobacteraceae bacterium]|nr:hypothetical protein [Paracoccaceae bacterium]